MLQSEICAARLAVPAYRQRSESLTPSLQLLSNWYELRTNARLTAELDVACGLARAADDGEYTRPEILTEYVWMLYWTPIRAHLSASSDRLCTSTAVDMQ